jgi:hypothetical protein
LKTKSLFSLSGILLYLLGTILFWLRDPRFIAGMFYFFLMWLLYILISYFEANSRYLAIFRKWIFLLVVIYPLLAIGLRGTRATQGTANVHDNVLQMAAISHFLLNGINPYVENYFDTKLSEQSVIMTNTGEPFYNPALLHAVKMPWHMIAPTAIIYFSGPFDIRYLYLGMFIVSIIMVFFMIPQSIFRYTFTALYAFNPMFSSFTMGGRDDMFVLFWIIVVLFLLHRKRLIFAALFFGLALVSKHSAWLMTPFFLTYVYLAGGSTRRSRSVVLLKTCILITSVVLVFMLPFVIWDYQHMWADLISYPAGTLPTSFPINGYGLSNYLLQEGYISDMFDYFPAIFPQLFIGIPILIIITLQMRKNNSIGLMMGGYALFMFVYWFFSRFFHDNYIGYVTQLLVVALYSNKNIALKDFA